MASVKTSWEDLSTLGWYKQQVYNKANAKRNGTMNGFGDMALNEGFAQDYQWWSYNTVIGDPTVISRNPSTTTSEQTAWSYDNTNNSKPFKQSWTEEWTDTASASIRVSSSVSFSMNMSITIFDVASMGFDLTVSTDSTETESQETSHKLSNTWDMRVEPGEKLSLVRIITRQSEQVVYGQDFGLTAHSKLATKGDKYDDHYYWSFGLNELLGNPQGQLKLQGSGRSTSYGFKVVREGPNGGVSETALPIQADKQGQ